MAKVDFARVLVFLVHGEVDDPAEVERALFNQVQLAANLVPHSAGKGLGTQRLVTGKEGSITVLKAQLLANRLCPFWPDVLGQRATARALFPEDVAQTRLALFLGPGIHAVTERALSAARGRASDDAEAILGDQFGENLKARAVEVLGHVCDLKRVAQVRLIAAVFLDRIKEGDTREGISGHLAALAELGENAMQHGF